MYASGEKYEGEWLNDNYNGLGKYTYARDDIDGRDYYIGEFQDGEKNGNGKQIWRNGTTYDGEWQNDLRHGLGVFSNSDGSIIYQGEWENDEQKNL